jgi:hypothetical protein
VDFVGMNDGVSFLGDVYYFTFPDIEGHYPLVFPFLELIKVLRASVSASDLILLLIRLSSGNRRLVEVNHLDMS